MRSCVGANDWDTVSSTHLQLLNCSEMLMTHFTRILHIRCHVLQPFLQERSIPADSLRSMTHNHRSIYIYPDAVPPIHAVSYHVATDKVTAQNGDKFRSILATIYNQSQLAERKYMARYWSINTAATAVPLSTHPSPLVITTKLAAAILGGPLFGRGVLPAQYASVLTTHA